MKIIIINGPNMNLLGKREVGIYGCETLQHINEWLNVEGDALGASLEFFQSNSEGEIVDIIQNCADRVEGIVINPASLSQSYPISEALKGIGLPVVEVHMSNIYAREEWHSKSIIAPIALGQISGFGKYSYLMGITALEMATKIH
ncbi:type II 3-dehydroquinate dehydratase [Paenibacillus sp. NPDC057934]|uniref:type II 3-dehydroquinate dehydratase n=1 Tax=Paenibacillus sp. NPDC057934 TaxID=3346282 RepID=UPI0036DAFF46